MQRLSVLVSFVLFIALCISLTYWTMQFLIPSQRPVAAAPQAIRPALNLGAASVLFGKSVVAPDMAGGFQLTGVIVARNPSESIAILSVDSKPSRSIGVGREVSPGVVINDVHPQYVVLSNLGIISRVPLSRNVKTNPEISMPRK